MLITQKNVKLTLKTPLGADDLILDRFEGTETISEPFCFTLHMHSASPSLNLSALVGKEVHVTYNVETAKRYFSGIVGSAEQMWSERKGKNSFTFYQAKVRPKFWMLQFTRDYRIFQSKSAMDIVKLILHENGVTDMEDKTTSCGKNVREYCVQYGESCYHFVCRLLEEEGIFYFFKHTAAKHIMVLCDDSHQARAITPANIEFVRSYSDSPKFNLIHTLRIQEQVVSKKFATADYNFETPSTHLYNKVSGNGVGGQVYDYPGIFLKTPQGDKIANHRIQDLEWNKKIITGQSTVPLFSPMNSFTLSQHPRSDANKKYIVHQVHHRINQTEQEEEREPLYENEFLAFPATIPFRPPLVTEKPLIYSTQTAIVTTKAGEEIWCDEYGRIKVKFHWDQRGPKNEKSSCWIRVAQLWAGSAWGGLFTPRIGMEVVVTFLDGDPDRPLITGCVYNGNNLPPYAKSEPTKSTIKSNSSKGGGGYNEFRFEDKKGSEEIFTHAQKDQNTIVEHSRTLLIKTGDDTTDITTGKRTVTLKGEGTGHDKLVLDKGNRKVHLKGPGAIHTLKIDKGNKVTQIDQGHSITKTQQGNNATLVGQGNRIANIMQGDNVTNIASGNNITKIVQGNCVTSLTQGNQMIQLSAGNLVIQVNGNISISASGKISMVGAAGVTIKGASVSIG
jgi:type VI secretion system secreted protein VgrG